MSDRVLFGTLVVLTILGAITIAAGYYHRIIVLHIPAPLRGPNAISVPGSAFLIVFPFLLWREGSFRCALGVAVFDILLGLLLFAR